MLLNLLPKPMNHAKPQHQEAPLPLVLLVNLGSPTAPTPREVRRYLRQFLRDRRVVELPRVLWWCILNGIILPLRARPVARLYASIFTDKGSPLVTGTAALSEGLRTHLHQRAHVDYSMRYGQPSMDAVLGRWKARGIRKLIVLPLYPQYAASTTGTVFDKLARVLMQWRWIPDIRYINGYYDEPGYIEALAESVRSQRKPDHTLVISFHGLPIAMLKKGDPYYCHCHKTARLLAARLGLPPESWRMTFQSRFGRDPWLQPYTDTTLEHMAQEGITKVQVVCPGFAIDCLETLEEIGVENRDIFLRAGGKSFDYIPCLNDSTAHQQLLATIVSRQLDSYSAHQPHSDEIDQTTRDALYATARQSLGIDD